MSDLDLVGLRKIAGKATPGRWVFSPDDGSALDADAVLALDDSGEEVSTVTAWLDANDAAHIAAFDPSTVLALLDRIEELERAISEIPKHCGGSFTAYDGYTSVAVADGEAIKEILEGVNHDDK